MITYLDSSALVKLYVRERGSDAVADLVRSSEILGTALVSRTEVVAALAKAIRVGRLDEDAARRARQHFEGQWDHLVRLSVSEAVTTRAGELAWRHGLRGYDALHLAAALTWQELGGHAITFATFDHDLWNAAGTEADLPPWPEDLSRFTGD